jgi:hypothetical protein
MLKQNYISIINSLIAIVVIFGLCMLSFNWANFKKIYNVKEVNIYGTTFFDQSIIQE